MNKNTMEIAIIGGGFSGSLLAAHINNLAEQPVTINIFNNDNHFGRGVAYSTPHLYHLLNVPAKKMSAFENIPDHFCKWLNKTHSNVDNVENKFISRKWYGDYIQDILKEANDNKKFCNINFINNEVVSIDYNNNINIGLESGKYISADKVTLALGNPPPSRILKNDSKNIINNPWDFHKIKKIDQQSDVLIIGSGLTMVDVMLSLDANKHQGNIYCVSRHGLLPLAHDVSINPIDYKNIEKSSSILQMSKHIRHFIKKNPDTNWRAVIDGLRPITQELWQNFDNNNKQRFIRHLRAFWDVHRHRIAVEVANTINNYKKTGQLLLIPGRISNFNEDLNGLNILVKPRGQNSTLNFSVSTVINCTGPQADYRKINSRIAKDLINKGFIIPDDLKLGVKTNNKSQVINNKGATLNNMYAMGPMTKGELWEIIAVPDIRKQAEALAKQILID